MKDAFPANPGVSDWLRRAGRVVLSLALDVGIVLVAYVVALELKFDGTVPNESWRQLAWAGPLIAFAYILAYQSLGVYRTAWQYGSVRDALLLFAAVALVTAGILAVNLLLPKRPIPLSVNVISAAFIFLFHGMARMLPRIWGSGSLVPMQDAERQRVLIVGAGDTGQLLAWELQHNRSQPYRAVAFVDEDPALRGKRVHGIPVVGTRHDIPAVLEKHVIDLVAIALPPAQASSLQEILALCEPSKVPVRLVPRLSEIMEGRAQRGELREITMDDLLGRVPVAVDDELCEATISGRVVLITGAGGSIGIELSRKVAALNPAALHLVDINETALYELRNELRRKAANADLVKAWLCSIADRQRLDDVFEASRPQVVFHLAAYKIVPMMEEHPDQAFETNVLGTLNVFEAAQAVQADQVVFPSSHTAVNPASLYGASKRVGELLVASMAGQTTRICAMRLTNVIDAKGAVLSLFARQLQGGGPISVTDPEVARYFLTISEVAGLVIQAAAMSRGGEIFLIDVGDEVRIGELAERLIRSQGMEPGKDIAIEYIGLRPGDKVRENLIGEHESLLPTSHPALLTAISSLTTSAAELRAGIRELEVDRRRTGNLPARLHALARIDRAPTPESTSERLSLQEP
ncbi:MAG: SDR family NAD(P)-dependent oxidoreductase [Dehalococcoidia bacterium]|nr:SDR family NAD(P)-dependent oxidoreductase [Dehalococcoidia bacterium]